MPPRTERTLRKIELTREEKEGLDLRNYHARKMKLRAVSEVILENDPGAYDRLEELNRQTCAKERVVDLVTSREKSHAESGYVISIRNAGSGHRFFINKNKLNGIKTRINLQTKDGNRVLHKDTPEYLEQEQKVIGEEVTGLTGKNGKPVRTLHVRRKSREYGNGTGAVVVNMAGPLVKIGRREGLSNTGTYSIDNLREYIVQEGMREVEAILENEKKHPGHASYPIFLDFRGHSRGGVATLEGAMALNRKLRDKYGDEVYNRIRFDIIQYDPVPGIGSRIRSRSVVDLYGKQGNVSEEHNPDLLPFRPGQVNSTLFYSVHQQHTGMVFTPERVLGADRIIFTITNHDINLGRKEDYRQVEEEDDGSIKSLSDGKAHRLGYTDAITGKKYRSSGISSLEKGIYICDENNNLIRVHNKMELRRIFDGILAESGHQSGRYTNLLAAADSWFDAEPGREEEIPQKEDREQAEDRLRLAGFGLLAPERQNIVEVAEAARGSKRVYSEAEIAAAITKQNVKERNIFSKTRPALGALNAGESPFRYCTVLKEAYSNQREYLSRRAVKTMAAVLMQDFDASNGIDLDGMPPEVASAFLRHTEGSRAFNVKFAEEYKKCKTDGERGMLLETRLREICREAAPECEKSRDDSLLVQDYDAVYGRLRCFDNMKQALEFMKQKGLLSPGLLPELRTVFNSASRKWTEADRQMSVIMDPCYRYVDLEHTADLPAKDFKNTGLADPQFNSYLMKACRLHQIRTAERVCSKWNLKDEKRPVMKDHVNAGVDTLAVLEQEYQEVNKGFFIGSSEFHELRDAMVNMQAVYKQLANRPVSEKQRMQQVKLACREVVRKAAVYINKKNAETLIKGKSFRERDQKRFDFAGRLSRLAREGLDTIEAIREKERIGGQKDLRPAPDQKPLEENNKNQPQIGP